ncbi:MAG: hypothetical protein RLO17_24165 [Cyclobacteriaceae bacterium]|jgi:uncharacterized protein YcbK (DUF882 family)|tara:strand:+ start:364 stop:651 length:288 start_codon:yes stop_codon:yes gene_type:complete
MVAKKRSSMGSLNQQAVDQTNQQLSAKEIEVLTRTSLDWTKLKPKTADTALYDQLIKEVKESTEKNENLAQLRSRLESLGKEGLSLAKEVISLIP